MAPSFWVVAFFLKSIGASAELYQHAAITDAGNDPAQKANVDQLSLGGWIKKPTGLQLLPAVFGVVGGFLQLASEMRDSESLFFGEAFILALREPCTPDDPIGPPRVGDLAGILRCW